MGIDFQMIPMNFQTATINIPDFSNYAFRECYIQSFRELLCMSPEIVHPGSNVSVGENLTVRFRIEQRSIAAKALSS
jgi:hypothetical protein